MLCIVSVSWYVFCLLVVLVQLSVLAKLLARRTPLRKPNRGKGIISTKPEPKSVYDFLGLVYGFIVTLCAKLSGAVYCYQSCLWQTGGQSVFVGLLPQ